MGFQVSVCADDYALSPAVSQGIVAALGAGRLSATSVMTTRPGWPRLAPALKPFANVADLGLHLDLTIGPLSGPLALPGVSGAACPTLGALIQLGLRGQLSTPTVQTALRAEIGRQLDRFTAEMGRIPDYLDGHQHVHLLPGVRTAVLDELSARGLAGKLWLRDSADTPWAIWQRGVEAKKALTVAALGFGFGARARARGFQTNHGFAGFSSFDPARDFGRDFASYLTAPGPSHLIMCHPGHVDAELAAVDPHTTSRERELAFLLSDEFTDLMGRAGARLARLTT